MRADFGSRLDHLFDEMCQMNTRIGCIAPHQSCFGGFALSPSLEPTKSSSDGGDDDDDDYVTPQTPKGPKHEKDVSKYL